MSTGKDYGLPEEYADWVEKAHFTAHEFEPMVRIVTEKCTALYPDGMGNWTPLDVHTFVAPKPKPTLPDVKPGAVMSWRANTSSSRRRGTLLSDGRWQVAIRNGDSGCILGAHAFWSKEDVLLDVDDDGFTVELGGLE